MCTTWPLHLVQQPPKPSSIRCRQLLRRYMIDGVEDKSRIGVTLDTCHAFAAGFDIKSEQGWEAFLRSFRDTVGWDYLSALHVNDRKMGLGSTKCGVWMLAVATAAMPSRAAISMQL